MHFRLARNKGATYVTLLWIASQKWIVADINEYHSLSLSSFSETKMRANVTHKHHPTLSGNEKRCLCIPKVRNMSSCACRIVSQMRKRLIMPPLIVRPHPRCICLKKVDSQKESIIMTPHTEFQKKYYQQVIEIHQKTGFSPRKIAKLQLVPVSVRQMYHWIAIFEAENGKGSPRRIMEAKKSKEQAEMESLKSRISELEESLRVERLRNRLNEKIIDIAEARWHIEIRKKAGTKR